MNKSRLAAYIQNIVHLTPEQLEMVLSFFHPSKHPKQEIIVRAGEVNQYMNFIETGCLRLYFVREDGQEATRHLAFEQQFATGLTSFISKRPSLEYLQAIEDSVLLRIIRKDFYYLLELIPAWEKFFRNYLEFAYINNLDIYHREITKSADERYKELLSLNPKAVQRLPNKIIASYLNMSPETLSRVKSKR